MTTTAHADEFYWLNDEPLRLGVRFGVAPKLNAGSDGALWILPPGFRGGYVRLTHDQVEALRRLAIGEDAEVETRVDGSRVVIHRAVDGTGRHKQLYAMCGDQRDPVDPAELLAFIEAWT